MFSKDYDALFTYPAAMLQDFLKQYDLKYPLGQFSRDVQDRAGDFL
jgi:hypothetical protein